jgi:hypothetical protein
MSAFALSPEEGHAREDARAVEERLLLAPTRAACSGVGERATPADDADRERDDERADEDEDEDDEHEDAEWSCRQQLARGDRDA